MLIPNFLKQYAVGEPMLRESNSLIRRQVDDFARLTVESVWNFAREPKGNKSPWLFEHALQLVTRTPLEGIADELSLFAREQSFAIEYDGCTSLFSLAVSYKAAIDDFFRLDLGFPTCGERETDGDGVEISFAVCFWRDDSRTDWTERWLKHRALFDALADDGFDVRPDIQQLFAR